MEFFPLIEPLIEAIQSNGQLPSYVPLHVIGQQRERDGFLTTEVHMAMKKGRLDRFLPNHLTRSGPHQQPRLQRRPVKVFR